ncbi:pre-rrna processing protein [Diplodia corticola]|uniref:Pre-rrna processing protein n=1 Tax=Diplodia corticola TaxID=236234 RepID=A0A1J9QSM1_9PEZI|nr:pre-rrna processing protein [Diplodia corticola]OJD30986.1 pre-rrna processing protein [Diplodia corticola]
MVDTPWGSTATPSPRPASTKSAQSARSSRDLPPDDHEEDDVDEFPEDAPLLAGEDNNNVDDDDSDSRTSRSQAAFSLLSCLRRPSNTSSDTRKKTGHRWPSTVALLVLCITVVVIMVLGFVVPAAVQEYANEAVDVKPTGLSFESVKSDGVSVRVQADFIMDASRVHKKSVRDLGRFSTWIAREIESGEAHVEVVLPDYSDKVVGSAVIPPVKLSLRNGHTTHINIVADLHPGQFSSIRDVANDWMRGRLGKLKVKGKAKVPLKSGIFPLGTQIIEEIMEFEGNSLPDVPAYRIAKLNVHEVDLPHGHRGLEANTSIVVNNDYPLRLTVPPLGFGILVGGCSPSDPQIMVADARTQELPIEPFENVEVHVAGWVRKLPDALMAACPNSKQTPLDILLGDFIHGRDAYIYVRGSDSPSVDTPKWLTDLMSDITVPVPFPGRLPENLLKNFSLTDVNFHLPGFFAAPDSPEGQPRIDAKIKALVGLPDEINFPVDVDKVRADADIFYHGKRLGNLDLSKWQPANATRIDSKDEDKSGLLVEAVVRDAPVNITDQAVFSEVVSALLFGSKSVNLSVKAEVDVEMVTSLGTFKVRKIPAEGVVPVKPIGSGDGSGHGGGTGDMFKRVAPKFGNLKILDTGPSSIRFQAEVNFTNPTNYSATVPYTNINILTNGTAMGQVTAENLTVVPGNNTGVLVQAVWDPLKMSGEEGRAVGVDFLSRWLSGFNTTLALQTHRNTIPAQPALGEVLSRLKLSLPTPKLRHGDDDDGDGADGDKPRFIKEATMHILSSTAIFTLSSPLRESTIYITHLNATARYHGEPAGRIVHELPFAVPPGLSQTPRLPVDWSLGSVGYDAIKKALGGQLRLNATATVGIKLGRWEERVWFVGGGIGAHVRL